MKKNIRMISILLAILMLAVVMNTASGAGSGFSFLDLGRNSTEAQQGQQNQQEQQSQQNQQQQQEQNQTDTNQTGVNQTDMTPSVSQTVESVTLKKLKKLKVKALTKKSVRISWTKLTKKQRKTVSKIEVQISTDKSFGSGVVTKFVKNTKSSLTVKGLKKKTKYYVRIRAYTEKDGVRYVSPWTSVKSAKTKKK